MIELIKTIGDHEYRVKANEAMAEQLVKTDSRYRLASSNPEKPEKPSKPEKKDDPKDPGKE